MHKPPSASDGSQGAQSQSALARARAGISNGKIEWYPADESLGRTAGNRVGVQINAPAGFDTSNVKVTIGGTDYNWSDIEDGNGYFWWYPLVTARNKEFTASVVWNSASTQEFKIVIGEGVTLEPGPEAANVTTFEELEAAVENPEIKTVNIMNNIAIEKKVNILSGKHIIGNGYTLTADSSKDGWSGFYVLHFYKTAGSVEDIKITGADAAIYVNGSVVKISGEIDVSGNEFGGIEVSKGSAVNEDPELTIADGTTLINSNEANNIPTIWEDQIESADADKRVQGYESMKVDHYQKTTENMQRFYFLDTSLSAPDKAAAKAAIKPSWVMDSVDNVTETDDLPEGVGNANYKVTIKTTYGNLQTAQESGRTVTTYFTIPDNVTVWYPAWEDSTLTYKSATGGEVTYGMVAHPLNSSMITAEGVVYVSVDESVTETEFEFIIRLVDAADDWNDVIYGEQTLTVSVSPSED